MLQIRDSNRDSISNRDAGFTLVEMLIAVALVLLMMTLFAEVFSIATGSMSRQKGLAENDQRARMVATLLNSDLRKRTFRDVVPYSPGVSTAAHNANREGYICYSENTVGDDTDDVLRLTIDTSRSEQDLVPEAYVLFGKATELGSRSTHPNQPDGDDGVFTGASNSSGQSTMAEVVWFLRNGNLYRRMVLIRKPYRDDVTEGTPTTSNPPTSTPLIGGSYSAGTGNFYTDFDYSAFFNTGLSRPQFHDAASLRPAKGVGTYNLGLGFPVDASLTIPHLRFGHSLTISSGAPRETTNTGAFIGCFTHTETSSPSFQHPGSNTAGMSDPFTRALTLDPTTQAIIEYPAGTRMAEDLLLSNVLSFDIKIWDDAAGNGPDQAPGFAGVDDDGDGSIDNNSEERGGSVPASNLNERGAPCDDGDWVDVGHSNWPGYYFKATSDPNGANTAYGNRFDTWTAAQALSDPAPYQAMRFVPPGTRAAANFPFRERDRWQMDHNYNPGDIVLPTGALGAAPAHEFAFLCIGAGQSASTEPIWPTSVWATLQENPLPPPIPPPVGVTWQAIPNLPPVKGIRIQIRYLDISSGLVKDLTLVESLRDQL